MHYRLLMFVGNSNREWFIIFTFIVPFLSLLSSRKKIQKLLSSLIATPSQRWIFSDRTWLLWAGLPVIISYVDNVFSIFIVLNILIHVFICLAHFYGCNAKKSPKDFSNRIFRETCRQKRTLKQVQSNLHHSLSRLFNLCFSVLIPSYMTTCLVQ